MPKAKKPEAMPKAKKPEAMPKAKKPEAKAGAEKPEVVVPDDDVAEFRTPAPVVFGQAPPVTTAAVQAPTLPPTSTPSAADLAVTVPPPTPTAPPAPTSTSPPKDGVGPEVRGVRLQDFKRDESLVFPRGAAPEIQNITLVEPGHYRFVLRHRGDPWSKLNPRGVRGAYYDGDRDLQWNEGKRDGKYHDKSRAEMVFADQPTIKIGETWEFGFSVRLDATFRPSEGYCNVCQPVFDQSFVTLVDIRGDDVTAQLTVFESGIGSRARVARSFVLKRGTWTSVRVRVKFAKDGFYRCSVDGDDWARLAADTTKGDKPFRFKVGLYGSATRDVHGNPLNDSIVEHRDIYMRRIKKKE